MGKASRHGIEGLFEQAQFFSNEYFVWMKSFLEDMLTIEFLLDDRSRSHPARIQWELCNTVIEQKGELMLPEQEDSILDIARVVLNASAFLSLVGGDLSRSTLDLLALIESEGVRKKILTRVRDARQYEDILVELYIGAFHMFAGHTVEFLEEEGMPDLVVRVPEVDCPIYIECKRLSTSSANRINKVIADVNKKSKIARSQSGNDSICVAVLDVKAPIGVRESGSDVLEKNVEGVSSLVQAALSGNKNRSVSAAILIWDVYLIGKMPFQLNVPFVRRTEVIKHADRQSDIFEEVPFYCGDTVFTAYPLVPRKEPVRSYEFTESHVVHCESAFDISRESVIDTIEKSDRKERIVCGGKEMIFYLSRARGIEDCHLLVLGERKIDCVAVDFAFKIYNDLCSDTETLSPMQVLERLADRFGLLITIGDETAKYIHHQEIQIPSGNEDISLFEIHRDEGVACFFHMFAMKYEDQESGSITININDAFCINTAEYSTWLNAHV